MKSCVLVLVSLLALLAMGPTAAAGGPVGGTNDVYYGPAEGASQAEWQQWFDAMKVERAHVLSSVSFDPSEYVNAASTWSRHVFRQFFLFMYDQAFYDRASGHYKMAEMLREREAVYGPIDVVLLWQAYPRLGFDSRNQFSFYRDMPGGLAKLRSEVSDVLHARGVKVYLDYNPWDVSGDLENEGHRREYAELAKIVQSLDADGIMLDTLSKVPLAMKAAIARVKTGVIFSPEDRPPDADLSRVTQSWAQWSDYGDGRPSIYRDKWLVPEHRQFAIRRWDMDRSADIKYSFFNGSGLLLWDNVFGSWNPYIRADRRLIAETGVVLRAYDGLLADGEWLPLVPTDSSGLQANVWKAANGHRLTLLRNTGDRDAVYVDPNPVPQGLVAADFWPPSRGFLARGPVAGVQVVVPAGGVQALAIDELEHARSALVAFAEVDRAQDIIQPDSYEDRTPTPQALAAPDRGEEPGDGPADRDLLALPGGHFTMTISHLRRESGCYPFGATDNAMWGYYERDTITHKIDVDLTPYAIKRTAVTNDEYLAFVRATGYEPADAQNFLKQLPRARGGALPAHLAPALGGLPVTYVSLDDARAYAHWRGESLPSEAQWQWAAEGAGQGNPWPWGRDESRLRDARVVNLTHHLAAADANVSGATPQGAVGLTGNTWELTESEYSDGHNRFVMLRGGVYLPTAESEWIIPRGPRPNSFHAKYLLVGGGLDRSDTVSFRTVK